MTGIAMLLVGSGPVELDAEAACFCDGLSLVQRQSRWVAVFAKMAKGKVANVG